jgi:hypothetical protein
MHDEEAKPAMPKQHVFQNQRISSRMLPYQC